MYSLKRMRKSRGPSIFCLHLVHYDNFTRFIPQENAAKISIKETRMKVEYG